MNLWLCYLAGCATGMFFCLLVNLLTRNKMTDKLNDMILDFKSKDEQAEVKRLCDSLSEIIKPESLGEWFQTPNTSFDGLTPVEVIKKGEINRLWEMFYRLRSGTIG